MSFAREGLDFVAIAALAAAGTYALALNRRSWPLWLVAFGLTAVALLIAYSYRDVQRTGWRGERVEIVAAENMVSSLLHGPVDFDEGAGTAMVADMVTR